MCFAEMRRHVLPLPATTSVLMSVSLVGLLVDGSTVLTSTHLEWRAGKVVLREARSREVGAKRVDMKAVH